MGWNYRIVQYQDGTGFGLHEVYYDETGRATAMTQEAVDFTAETLEELREVMILANTDAKRRPVFVEPEEWCHE